MKVYLVTLKCCSYQLYLAPSVLQPSIFYVQQPQQTLQVQEQLYYTLDKYQKVF